MTATPIAAPGESGTLADDTLNGATEIAEFVYGRADKQTVRKVYYIAENGILTIGRLGSGLIASRRRLRGEIDALTGGAR